MIFLVWLMSHLFTWRGWGLSFSFALNGGGRIFHSPSSPLFSLLALLYCLIYWETLSALLSKLKDYGFDQLVSKRNWHHLLDEKLCPDGTFAAGYMMDAWERWRIVCLAALSVEDIKDIYLFGTMITGLLLIGLGFALGYRRIQKTGTAVQSLTRLPVMTEAVGRAVSIETETIITIWILSRRSSRLCKEKLMVETRMDKESSCGIGMRLLAPRLNNRNLIFFGSHEQ